MDSVSIAVICLAVFGVVGGLKTFVRKLLSGQDKILNDKAQRRAVARKAAELEVLRLQVTSSKRFDAHYQVLGSNRDAIEYLDQRIAEKFRRKSALIQGYAEVIRTQSSAIIAGEQNTERRLVCDRLRIEFDNELQSYNSELANLQTRRANLWDTHREFHEYLVEQETRRSSYLDDIYHQHTSMLDKLYVRYNENTEAMVRLTIEAGTVTFKTVMMAPDNLLIKCFKKSEGISPDAAREEQARRREVQNIEDDLDFIEGPDAIPAQRQESLVLS